MTPDQIALYQPGGSAYATLQSEYGTANANAIAAAAQTGDEGNVNTAITQAQFGAPLDTSTADAFATQIETNPLAAPLADANTLVSNTFLSFLKSPAVLGLIALIAFFALGGLGIIKKQIKNRS